jgi:hypothetical protein
MANVDELSLSRNIHAVKIKTRKQTYDYHQVRRRHRRVLPFVIVAVEQNSNKIKILKLERRRKASCDDISSLLFVVVCRLSKLSLNCLMIVVATSGLVSISLSGRLVVSTSRELKSNCSFRLHSIIHLRAVFWISHDVNSNCCCCLLKHFVRFMVVILRLCFACGGDLTFIDRSRHE